MITTAQDRAIARADLVRYRREARATGRQFASAARRGETPARLQDMADTESDYWDSYAEACDRL